MLAVLSHRAEAGHYTSSIEINATAEKIWPWLGDGEKAKQWVSWLLEVRRTSTGKNAVANKEVWVMKDPNMNDMLIPVEGTCTEYVRPSRLSVKLEPQGFAGDQTYVLTPAGTTGTRLSVDSHFKFPGWFPQLMEPMVAPAVRKKMRADLARLKAVVEALPGVRGE